MTRLQLGPLAPCWSEFLHALFRDLAPLGHILTQCGEDTFALELIRAEDVADPKEHWKKAHAVRHQALLWSRIEEIHAFEKDFSGIFVDMRSFQPSAISPILEIVDFKAPDHLRIIEYLKLYQTVKVGRLVGRRVGLLIWDIGQTAGPYLLGAAVLASPRFSQKLRDRRLGWAPDYPRTHTQHDQQARNVRVAGLNRMMQLSLACALPPYSVLSGAWLAALAPFTNVGLDAFRSSLKTPDPNADLAAIATTTGMGVKGSPFQGHRVAQLAPSVSVVSGASGNIYAQARPDGGLLPLRVSFESLISDEVRGLALDLFKVEKPERFARLRSPGRSALAHAFRRLKLRRWILAGNEIGVHLGMLGEPTLEALRYGRPRALSARPLIDWQTAVGVWSRRFLPAPENVGESADERSRAEHREARQKRLNQARSFANDRILLSSRLSPEATLNADDAGSFSENKLTSKKPSAEGDQQSC